MYIFLSLLTIGGSVQTTKRPTPTGVTNQPNPTGGTIQPTKPTPPTPSGKNVLVEMKM